MSSAEIPAGLIDFVRYYAHRGRVGVFQWSLFCKWKLLLTGSEADWESVADEPEKKHRKGHSILQTWSIVWKARNGFLKAEIQSVCETCWGCPLVLGSGGWGGGDLQSPAQAGWDPVSHRTPVCFLLSVCFKPGHLQLLLPHSPASQRGRNIGTNWRSPDDNTERPVPPP